MDNYKNAWNFEPLTEHEKRTLSFDLPMIVSLINKVDVRSKHQKRANMEDLSDNGKNTPK